MNADARQNTTTLDFTFSPSLSKALQHVNGQRRGGECTGKCTRVPPNSTRGYLQP